MNPKHNSRIQSVRTNDSIRLYWLATLTALLSLGSGCGTPGRLPAINLDAPGWDVRQGQALWRREPQGAGVAGEVTLATHPDGRSWVQFSKPPLPLLSAESVSNRWQIEFIPQDRFFAGKGTPPDHFLWVHLARAVAGTPPPAPLQFELASNGDWAITNAHTGEMISGYFSQ